MIPPCVSSSHVELTLTERLRFYAPTLLAAWLAGLCIAFTIASAYATSVRDPLVITAAGLFGFAASGSLAALLFYSQRAQLRYLRVAMVCPESQVRERLRILASECGWTVLVDEPRRWCAEYRTSVFTRDALVHVQFAQHVVGVAVIPDYDAGWGIGSRNRLRELRQRVIERLQRSC